LLRLAAAAAAAGSLRGGSHVSSTWKVSLRCAAPSSTCALARSL
jgi:hypothetical protein